MFFTASDLYADRLVSVKQTGTKTSIQVFDVVLDFSLIKRADAMQVREVLACPRFGHDANQSI